MRSKLTCSRLLIAAALASPLGACQKHEPAATKTQTSSRAKSQAAPAASAAAKSLTVDQFLSEIPPTTCKALDRCKNDKVKATIEDMMTMLAGFGVMDHPELQKQFEGVQKAMKKKKAFLPDEKQCETIGSLALQVSGLTADALKQKIGKTVKYDGQKAEACLAVVKGPFAPCATEVKLTKDLSIDELDKAQKEFDIDGHTKACNDVLVGMVQAGQSCEYDYECAGEHSRCKRNPKDRKAKICVNPKAKAKHAGKHAPGAKGAAKKKK